MKKILGGLAAACLAGVVAAGAAAAPPTLPATITMVVPFPPGGSNDVFARVLAEKLGGRVGATVIVENRPGAGGAIGAEYVARAAKDLSLIHI